MNHTTERVTRVSRGGVALATTALATTLVIPLLLAAPAGAETVTVEDENDTPILADIHRAKIVHAKKRVRVRVDFDDLLRNPKKKSQGLSVFIDTDPEDKGPEYVFAGGLNLGTDYVLSRIETWTDEGPHVTGCHQKLRINWDKDVAVASVGRACLGRPASVRVAVKSGEWRKGKGTRYDWLAGRRVFTDALGRA